QLEEEKQQLEEPLEQKHHPLQSGDQQQQQQLLQEPQNDPYQQIQQQKQPNELIVNHDHHQQFVDKHQQEQEVHQQKREQQQQQQRQKQQQQQRDQQLPGPGEELEQKYQFQRLFQQPRQFQQDCQSVGGKVNQRKQRRKRSSNTIFIRDIVKQQSVLCPTSAQFLITGESAGPSNASLNTSLAYSLQPHPRIAPTLENILSTINVGCRLDLRVIAQHALNADYNPEFFSGLVMRLKEPRATALMFSSGRIVVTGTRSEDSSRLAARKFARILQKIGFEARFEEFRVRNVVASCSIGSELNIEGIFLTHNNFCTYEPDLFPGLIYQMFRPQIILLIFSSGKVVLTGSKDWSDIYTAFKSIYPVLQGFRIS
ncbi:TATA-box-binding protein-like, partial [Varroa jacobsoni]